jgi:hypothetical protein
MKIEKGLPISLNDQIAHPKLMWPTPTTRDYKDGTAKSCKNVPVNGLLGRAVHMWPTPTTINRNSRNAIMKIGDPHKNHGAALGLEQVVELAEGQLPKEFNSIEEVPEYYMKMLPTPHANCGNGIGEHGTGGQNLQTAAGGQLNPTWVEWLMGFPVGWTDIGE